MQQGIATIKILACLYKLTLMMLLTFYQTGLEEHMAVIR